MKLRIHENSIRLRMSEDEIAELASSGQIRRWIRFGPEEGAALAYSVEIGERGRPADAEFGAGGIRLFLRAEDAARLAAGGETSIEGEHVIGGGGVLRVRIERDFAP